MSDQENQIIEVELEQVEQAEEVEQPEVEDSQESAELVVTIGDEPAEAEEEKAPTWVKELRKKNREDQKRIRELEEQLKTREPEKQALGKKPALGDPDIDYDADKFEAALEAWQEQKRKADDEENSRKRAQEDQQKAWHARLTEYAEKKTALKVSDYDDAESTVTDVLDVTQQGIIVQYAKSPELVVYALGKNPSKLKDLAAIKDPIEFALAARELEKDLKVQKKSPPAPEKTVKGNAPNTSAVGSTLDKLRAEAEKTGDYSKVLQYKRQHKGK